MCSPKIKQQQSGGCLTDIRHSVLIDQLPDKYLLASFSAFVHRSETDPGCSQQTDPQRDVRTVSGIRAAASAFSASIFRIIRVRQFLIDRRKHYVACYLNGLRIICSSGFYDITVLVSTTVAAQYTNIVDV